MKKAKNNFSGKTKEMKKGITLIALVITVILMLIIAGVTIGPAINGSFLFDKAEEAVEKVGKREEMEQIKEAIVMAKGLNKRGQLLENEFQSYMNRMTGEDKAIVYESADGFKVLYENKRIYTVDSEGNLQSEVIAYKKATQTFATQITNNNLGKTEETAYEINSIEDLLDLSYAVNGITVAEDGTLGTKTTNTFSGKYVKLMRDLDFKLGLSYEDWTRTDYGDINGDGEVENIKTELTTGKGWMPIGGRTYFSGTFDGNNKKISSLYIYDETTTDYTGLFARANFGTVKNLGVLGTIYCNSSYAGAIIGDTAKEINNCYFNGTIENIHASGTTGGILGTGRSTIINECYCKGKVNGTHMVGGLIGFADRFEN